MTHVLSMFDSEYLHHYDLTKPEATLTIASVVAGELTGIGGKKNKKPVLYFQGTAKGWALCKTDARTMISLYGPHVEEWIGKRITAFRSTTEAPGAPGQSKVTVECLRVKPVVPPADLKAVPDAG